MSTTSPTTTERSTGSARSAWATGGVMFAGVLMVINGIFQFFEGIAGIAKDQLYVAAPTYTLRFNVTAWGWIHLVLGILIAVVGYFIIAGAPWARMVGMFLVAVQLFTNFFFLPYYPIWALVIIALDVFVLWALAVAPVRDRR